ncbi:MAG TPA: hypothetical protein VMV72_11675 [Verrucomicrobiae bacterium]|nr:hypothetical protein [Verrucomicrobiae bacterium]
MALFGGMFSGGQKHPNFDQLSQSIQDNLGLQIDPPGEDVLTAVDSLAHHDLLDIQNAHTIEVVQDLLMRKSIRVSMDGTAQSIVLTVAAREEIENELKSEHTAVKVMHVGSHHGTSRIIRSFGVNPEPVKVAPPTTSVQSTVGETAAVPPAFEHLEATERLCPVVVDLFVKHGQLTTADKDVLKKIRPTDYTLDARMAALERWKAEVTRRSRGIHVREAGPTSLLGSDDAEARKSEDAILRRFDAFLHWLSKLIKAFEAKGVKFNGKPVWLPH